MNQTTFALSRFKNRNGVTSWRVSGYLAGVRIRRNFPTREEAAVEKSALELKVLHGAAGGVRTASTFLSNDQLRQAEAAFRRLDGAAQPLAFYLDYALANYRTPERARALADAVKVYVEAKERDEKQRLLTLRQYNSIRWGLDTLVEHFPGITVDQLSADQLKAHCQRGMASPKTANNRRGIIATFFKFAFDHDWIATNPMTKVANHRIASHRGSAASLTAEQAKKLMHHVEHQEGGAFVPFFALALFAGIRPCVRSGEIAKLKAEHVRLDTGVVHIEPSVSKVKMKRNVTIQPNLAAWLTAYPVDRFPIVPAGFQKTRAEIAKTFGLSHDIMRHTFISMHVAKFRSMGDAVYRAYQCGQLLNRQKDGLEHGQWEKWLAANCPEIAPCTAQRYMKLAKKANESLLGSATSVRQAFIGAGVLPEGKRKPADPDANTPTILFTHGLDQFKIWFNRRVASEPVDRWPPDSRHLLRNELAWFKRLYDDLGGDEPESPCGAVH